MVAAPTVEPETIRQVAARVPLVLVGQMGQAANPDVPYVAPDPRAAGVALIDHVLTLGHRRIALLAFTPERSPTQWARISWIRDQLDARDRLAGLAIIDDDTDLAGVIADLRDQGATAILTNNDWTAFDAMAAAGRLGLRVPEDLTIVGHDGIPPLDHEAFGLTTYRVPIDAMAEAAVRIVDGMVRGATIESHSVLLAGDLVIGRTSGPVPTS